jgi:hypothetical protein
MEIFDSRKHKGSGAAKKTEGGTFGFVRIEFLFEPMNIGTSWVHLGSFEYIFYSNQSV